MKKFYNQETKSIKEFMGYQTIRMELDIPNLYGLNYYRDLDSKMKKFVEGLQPTALPTVFELHGDFTLLDKHADEEDKQLFLLSITGIFVSHLLTKDRTEGEFRLTAPKSLANIKLSSLVKKDLANKVLLFPNFAIDVCGLNGEAFYEVI